MKVFYRSFDCFEISVAELFIRLQISALAPLVPGVHKYKFHVVFRIQTRLVYFFESMLKCLRRRAFHDNSALPLPRRIVPVHETGMVEDGKASMRVFEYIKGTAEAI